jgi:predicted  nucleic acid-binding Zn-ribbon protein
MDRKHEQGEAKARTERGKVLVSRDEQRTRVTRGQRQERVVLQHTQTDILALYEHTTHQARGVGVASLSKRCQIPYSLATLDR